MERIPGIVTFVLLLVLVGYIWPHLRRKRPPTKDDYLAMGDLAVVTGIIGAKTGLNWLGVLALAALAHLLFNEAAKPDPENSRR